MHEHLGPLDLHRLHSIESLELVSLLRSIILGHPKFAIVLHTTIPLGHHSIICFECSTDYLVGGLKYGF